jgi:hypothetical protein
MEITVSWLETPLGQTLTRCDIMRFPIRALCVLGLAAFLALPAAASECENSGGSPLVTQKGAPAQAPGLAEIFTEVPEPLWMTGTVDCSACGVGTSSPGYLCMQECRSMGYFVNNCEADATTCQLIACNCLYDEW